MNKLTKTAISEGYIKSKTGHNKVMKNISFAKSALNDADDEVKYATGYKKGLSDVDETTKRISMTKDEYKDFRLNRIRLKKNKKKMEKIDKLLERNKKIANSLSQYKTAKEPSVATRIALKARGIAKKVGGGLKGLSSGLHRTDELIPALLRVAR